MNSRAMYKDVMQRLPVSMVMLGIALSLFVGGCKHIPRGDVTLPPRSHELTSAEQRHLPAEVLMSDGTVATMPETCAERFALVRQALLQDIEGTPPAWVVQVLEHDATLPPELLAVEFGLKAEPKPSSSPYDIPHSTLNSSSYSNQPTDPRPDPHPESPFPTSEEEHDWEPSPETVGTSSRTVPRTVLDKPLPAQEKAMQRPTGYAPSQDLLARMTLEGDGVKEDSAKAFSLALDAARQGLAQSQILVATLYTLGRGVQRDTEQAFHWLWEAARSDNPEAMLMLADTYRQGEGVAKDEQEAFLWTRKAAERGLTRAHLWLGLHYYYGLGTPKDGASAAALLRPFADLGDVESQRCMGILAYEGRGIKQNFAIARHYFGLASEANDSEASLYLGVMQHKGQGGPQDMAQARHYFLAGAHGGDARCMSLLATMYELGEGASDSKPDKVTAYAWYTLARQHGDKACAPFLAALHDELTSQELTEAQNMMLTLQIAR